MWSRCRFHAVLAPGQEIIDVPVFKMSLAAIMSRNSRMFYDARAPPLQVPQQKHNQKIEVLMHACVHVVFDTALGYA